MGQKNAAVCVPDLLVYYILNKNQCHVSKTPVSLNSLLALLQI